VNFAFWFADLDAVECDCSAAVDISTCKPDQTCNVAIHDDLRGRVVVVSFKHKLFATLCISTAYRLRADFCGKMNALVLFDNTLVVSPFIYTAESACLHSCCGLMTD